MSGIFEQLAFYFEYPFVRYAMIVGGLIALCSSLLGVTLVLKRFSFIGDGLSHVAFGAIAIGAVLNLTDEMLIVAPVTIICAVLLLRTGQEKYAVLPAGQLRPLAERYPAGAAAAAIGLCTDAEREISFNANPAQAALTLALRMEETRKAFEKYAP